MPDSILRKLSELTNRPPTPEYQAEYQAQVDAEKNDRGAVLLIGANLENILESTIEKFLFPDRASKLFGPDKPLGSFRNKILIAHALNIFGDDTFRNFEIVRGIRNAFAHAKIPISFTTPEVRNACDLIDVGLLAETYHGIMISVDPVSLRGLERFKHACHWMSSTLFRIWLAGPIDLDRKGLGVQLSSELERIVALPKPLP